MPPAAATNLGYTPRDGGWGWAVAFAAFISIGFSYAFPKSLTIYFKEIQEYFSVSYSEIAWVSSVMLASKYAGSPVSSMFVNRHGSRPVVMVGGLMVCVGMVLGSLGTSIINLYLCVRVIGGFGLAFTLQPALTITGTYFQVKRPLANGLAMAGSPVVLSTLASLNQFLLNSFGGRGSFSVLGFIVLNRCVAGALMKPRKSQSFVFIDISLFTHRGFLIFLIGNVVMFFGSFAPVVFLDPYAKHQGTYEYSAPLLLSIFALVGMFSRPVTEFLPNSRWIRPRIQYFFSFAVSYKGVCHLLFPLASGYGGLVVYSIFLGLAFEILSALLCEVLMDLVGAHRFSSAVGLVTIIECGPVLLGPPISGALVDVFGDYKYMYYACGALMLVPGVFLFIMHYYNYKKLDEDCRQIVAVEIRTSEEAVKLKINQNEKTSDETQD
uniref:Major facilitator superfamily (MFS) profile domain-containing protein n=1 Tax=Poecilia mexicana TaxID=48701 RepID=A0A3B3YFS4_9TELE